MKFSNGIKALSAASLLLCAAGRAQTPSSEALVSKNIPLLFGVADRFFAFNEYGKTYSRLNLFDATPSIHNGAWPWPGYVQDGVVWRNTLLLRSDSISDSSHVARVAGLRYDGVNWKISDTLVLPFGSSSNALSRGAGFTAMAVWHDTAILAFGKLGVTYAPLAGEDSDSLFTRDTLRFSSFPSQSGADTATSLATCVWNRICRVDSLRVPAAGVDSVLALAVDSSRSDSIWLLVATKSGLRRGLMGGKNFPHVSGIPDSDAVKNILAVPDQGLLWAFTDTHFFFSADHGRTFHVPDSLPGIRTPPSLLQAYGFTPQAAVFGDTTFVSFNLQRPGLVLFKRDSLQEINPDDSLVSEVLLSSDNGLGITREEGSLTSLAVARSGEQAILALGSNAKGIFYRRLDQSGTTFTNLNRLRTIQNSLSEVITFPTLFGSELVGNVPKKVHIGYRLKKSGRVTITVFNYAMEKVCTVVKDKPRVGGIARSENPGEDLWDGKDGSGRYVSVGVYYILVESDQGEHGFGKAMSLWGQK